MAGSASDNAALVDYVARQIAAIQKGPTATAFSPAIKYDADYRVVAAPYQQVGALTFTQDLTGSIIGGGTDFAVIADGVNIPSFAALGLLATAQGWSNVTNQIHVISTWRDAGGYAYGMRLAAIVAAPIPAPVFTAQSAPAGTVGTAYAYTFIASNAASYALASGTLPAGLALNAAGVLSGTPSAAATSAFTVSATNVTGTVNSTAQSVTIAAAPASGIYAADTFTGTNGTLLTAHAPTVGPAWLAAPGSAGTPLLSGGELVGDGTVTNSSMFVDALPSSADGIVSARMRYGGANYEYTGISARMSASAETRIDAVIGNAGVTAATYKIFEVIAGTGTELGAIQVADQTAGVQMDVELELIGTTANLYIRRLSDGFYFTPTLAWQAGRVACKTTSSLTVVTAGRAGARVANSVAPGSSIDNFSATT